MATVVRQRRQWWGSGNGAAGWCVGCNLCGRQGQRVWVGEGKGGRLHAQSRVYRHREAQVVQVGVRVAGMGGAARQASRRHARGYNGRWGVRKGTRGRWRGGSHAVNSQKRRWVWV